MFACPDACWSSAFTTQAQLTEAGIEPNEMQGTVNGSKPGEEPQPSDVPLKAE